jgi:hypothetical protein
MVFLPGSNEVRLFANWTLNLPVKNTSPPGGLAAMQAHPVGLLYFLRYPCG